MKHVVSVSIGSSKRDHRAEIDVFGEHIVLERRGTDGDISKAIALIKQLDGKVDAFGMGGIDLYIYAGTRRYTFRDAKKIAAAAVKTPIVDGSGLKNTLERQVVYQLQEQYPELLAGKKVLMTSALDRFGMAEAFRDLKCETIYGDVIFALGLSIPFRNLDLLNKYVARVVAPVVVQLPFKLLYPTGHKQDIREPHRFEKYYQWADIIAGDFHMIKKYLPESCVGKTILSNTVTQSDIETLRASGVKRLITTTPEIDGRSFGTNVMEGLIVSLLNKKTGEANAQEYIDLLDKMEFQPRILELN